MAHRIFRAPDGTRWEVWEVPGRDPASAVPRASPEGRQLVANGWLCFEGPSEKRRLTPIPPRWADRSEAELWLFCRVADPVPHETATPSPPDPVGG